jgi:hypothetical protein
MTLKKAIEDLPDSLCCDSEADALTIATEVARKTDPAKVGDIYEKIYGLPFCTDNEKDRANLKKAIKPIVK